MPRALVQCKKRGLDRRVGSAERGQLGAGGDDVAGADDRRLARMDRLVGMGIAAAMSST